MAPERLMRLLIFNTLGSFPDTRVAGLGPKGCSATPQGSERFQGRIDRKMKPPVHMT